MSETLGCGHPDKSRACGDCLDEAEAEVAKLELRLRDLALKAKAVMDDLEKHGPSIVPHLIDTDSNNGQYLRVEIEIVLGKTEKRKCPPHYWVGPSREESKCQLCGTRRNDDSHFVDYKSGSLCICCGLGKHDGECDTRR